MKERIRSIKKNAKDVVVERLEERRELQRPAGGSYFQQGRKRKEEKTE